MSKSHESSSLFLVRVWPEEAGDGQLEWRGKIQHVLSGEARPFCDWRELINTLLDLLPQGDAGDPAASRDE